MKKKIILLICCISSIVILQNCAVEISGLNTGYKKLTNEEKEKIVFLDKDANICDLKKDGKIYAITGKQLLKCIETQENVMVYKWVPHCTGTTCYPLSYVQKYCDSNGLTLYVIADYYNDTKVFIELENLSNPLFSTNEIFYKTKNRSKLDKKMSYDLLQDKKLNKKIWFTNTKIFNYGKLVDSDIKMEDEGADELQELKLNF